MVSSTHFTCSKTRQTHLTLLAFVVTGIFGKDAATNTSIASITISTYLSKLSLIHENTLPRTRGKKLGKLLLFYFSFFSLHPINQLYLKKRKKLMLRIHLNELMRERVA